LERRDFRRVKAGTSPARFSGVNAALNYLSDAVSKLCDYLAPPISFGLYAGAEAIFLYGLYRVFVEPHLSQLAR
jgi:hypothetical protein